MLRAVELGMSLSDLDLIDIGLLLDMIITKDADAREAGKPVVYQATQEDMDRL